jgi:potassium-transporting ATPase KdpC subunit
MKTILQALRLLVAMTLLTGVAYPLAVTAFARVAFPWQSAGSLVGRDGKPIGSALLAQKFDSPAYFWTRASAGDFATVPSGASNLGPTSDALRKAITERKAKFGENAPGDLLTSSASGLDPHISPAAAQWQTARVAAARNLPVEKVAALVAQVTEPPQYGIFGEPRVNVLALNLKLDAIK